MLIERDQTTERTRSEPFNHERVARSVSWKGLVRHEGGNPVFGNTRLLELRAGFLGRLAAHQSFRLGDAVRHQDILVLADGVLTLRRHDEVTRNQVRPLVQKLKERVLPVRTRLSPHDRPGGVAGDDRAVARCALAIAFHVGLLKVRREAMQILIVWQDRVRRRPEEIVIPDPERRHDHGNVLAQRGAPKVLVRLVGAGKQLFEVIHADDGGNRKTNGGPQRIPPAHPVPELEHVHGVDSKLHHRFPIGRKGYEMLGHGILDTKSVDEPLPCGPCVREGLLGGEGLGSDDEQRRLGLHFTKNLAQVRAVDVRYEVCA